MIFLVLCVVGFYLFYRWWNSPSTGGAQWTFEGNNKCEESSGLLVPAHVDIVESEEQSIYAVRKLLSVSPCVLGFDCEWVSNGKQRQPVALVQVANYYGYCALFRLNWCERFPLPLKKLLESENIYKLGVATDIDASYLWSDYSVMVRGAIDLRQIAKMFLHEPQSLAKLASTHLGVYLDKNWTIRASNWEQYELTPRQVDYAAKDALVAIKLFEKFLEYNNLRLKDIPISNIDRIFENIKDKPFTLKVKPHNSNNNPVRNSVKVKDYSATARSKPLYQNCYMLAPDGDLMCTCDYKKAQWYIEKGLAVAVDDNPLVIKLCFEPASRAVGTVGRYYQLVKENKCVVCGRDDSYIRKNVVPREYRKYFPEIMKDHSSHDVLLLCLPCHQRSNLSDQAVRQQLAKQFDAPFACSMQMKKDKYIEDVNAKMLKSAARALLKDMKKNNLPEERRKYLQEAILKHCPDCKEITSELLQKLCNLQVLYENEAYESHGKKVVDAFVKTGGLLKLEKLWRQHFLDSMKPRFLPDLWSINHNEERLKIRVREGRINRIDLPIVGLEDYYQSLIR